MKSSNFQSTAIQIIKIYGYYSQKHINFRDFLGILTVTTKQSLNQIYH